MIFNGAKCYMSGNLNPTRKIGDMLRDTLLDSWATLEQTPDQVDWVEILGGKSYKLMPTRAEARISDEIRAAHDELFGGTDVDDVMNPASWDFAQMA